MSINFEPRWTDHTVDHLTTEILARRLILSAARALPRDRADGLVVWCIAAEGGSHLLRVTKGLHQPEGPFADLMHITMELFIPGSKPGYLVRNTNFEGKFHLYVNLLKNGGGHGEYRLQPTALTYRLVSDDSTSSRPFIQVDIKNAYSVSSDINVAE